MIHVQRTLKRSFGRNRKLHFIVTANIRCEKKYLFKIVL